MSVDQQATLRTDDLCGTDASASIAPQQASPSSRTDAQIASTSCRTELMNCVGRINALRSLTSQVNGHYDRYAETGCLAALGDAHRVDLEIAAIQGDAS